MKRVLITGANSYVGTNVEKWLMKEPDKYYVETLDMEDPKWREFDFSSFDVVFHVAGIVHIKEKKTNIEIYYKINTDLVVETAKLSKDKGVNQFIYMSSMSIYGDNNGVVNVNTKINPRGHYGKSKLLAEEKLQKLSNENFKIVIIRPPMIFGPNCKGNYSKIRKLSLKLPIFPVIKNQRSFIFIDSLSNFLKSIIDNNQKGIFHPYNDNFISTSKLVEFITKSNKKNTIFIKCFDKILKLLAFIFRGDIRKLTMSLYYNIPADQLTDISIETAIKKTEELWNEE